ncbi:MAG: hypothetical protein MUO31_06620 [Thermodesulfovibrionales bacterium]|nr:hypothetical protein [Thermodesulfovibrionales bacterium]
MKIEQLLIQPHGTKIGGFNLCVKTFKKTWQVGETHWQQVICMDETGEIPVDVKLGNKYNPLRGRTTELDVIVAEVRDAEYLNKPRKILVVDQFTIPTQMIADYYAEPDQAYQANMKEIRGKIRHGLICSDRSAGYRVTGKKEVENYQLEIAFWAEFIMTGE